MLLRLLMVSAVMTLGLDADLPSADYLSRWATEARTWCNAREASTAVAAPCGWPQDLESFWAPDMPCAQLVEADNWDGCPDLPVLASTQPSNDDAFNHAMEQVVTAFVADLTPAPASPAEETAIAEASPRWEPVVIPADLYEGLAYELNLFQAASLPGADPAPPDLTIADVPPALDAEDDNPWTIALSCVMPETKVPVLATVNPLLSSDPSPTEIVPEPELTTQETPVATAESQESSRLSSALKLTGQAIHAWMSVLQAPAVAYSESSNTLSR